MIPFRWNLALFDCLAVGFEGCCVAGDFSHEVEDVETMNPGVRCSERLEKVLGEVAWVSKELEDARNNLWVEFTSL